MSMIDFTSAKNLSTLYTTVAGNEQFSLFITKKQYSFPCKNTKKEMLSSSAAAR